VFDEIFQAVRTLAISHASPYTTIDPGPLPTGNGLAIYPGPGYNQEKYFDRGGTYRVSIVLNGKDDDLGDVLPALSTIHKNLSRSKTYPTDTGWEIINIETGTAPHYIDREESGAWLCGSILTVEFYVKGV